MIAAVAPPELIAAVDRAKDRAGARALGIWITNTAGSVLSIWSGAFPNDREPHEALLTARLCSAGECPVARTIAAAEACEEVARVNLTETRLLPPYNAALAAATAARAVAAVEFRMARMWVGMDASELFMEAVLATVSARMPEDYSGAVAATVAMCSRWTVIPHDSR